MLDDVCVVCLSSFVVWVGVKVCIDPSLGAWFASCWVMFLCVKTLYEVVCYLSQTLPPRPEKMSGFWTFFYRVQFPMICLVIPGDLDCGF